MDMQLFNRSQSLVVNKFGMWVSIPNIGISEGQSQYDPGCRMGHKTPALSCASLPVIMTKLYDLWL